MRDKVSVFRAEFNSARYDSTIGLRDCCRQVASAVTVTTFRFQIAEWWNWKIGICAKC